VLPIPEDDSYTPPSTECGYTNEGSVGSEYIHGERNGPHT